MFEQFVRDKLAAKGVTVLHGDYDQAGDDGECDAVLETSKAVIFIELKSKLLTRKARSGDDVAALIDLAQAIVHPQAQAMSRHATLAKSGVLRWKSKGDEDQISLSEERFLSYRSPAVIWAASTIDNSWRSFSRPVRLPTSKPSTPKIRASSKTWAGGSKGSTSRRTPSEKVTT